MCFFDQYRFACGDFKWGHFRQHCANEYRTGETCGMKLVMQTLLDPGRCKLCTKIDTKTRRLMKEQARIDLWMRENPKGRKSSIMKAEEDINQLQYEIADLQYQREAGNMAL